MRNPNQETWESFSEFLSSKGLRMTDQRKGVIEALFRQSGHFTAEQLLRDAQDLDETVSRATLYRSLPLLVESGIIRKVDVGQDNKFYVLNGQSETFKAQVICSDCNHIEDIDAPFMEWYGKTVSENLGMKVKDHACKFMPNVRIFANPENARNQTKYDRNQQGKPSPPNLPS